MTRQGSCRLRHAVLVAGTLAGCRPRVPSAASSTAAFNPGPAPATLADGEHLFGRYCGSCHGEHGTGDILGPSFLDTVYRQPRFTGQLVIDAVLGGVKQRYWKFGDMPALRRVTGPEILAIYNYIVWVQERAQFQTVPDTAAKVIR